MQKDRGGAPTVRPFESNRVRFESDRAHHHDDLAAARSRQAKATRTFEYTEDGKVLVTFQSVSATGKYSTGHWSADIFGTPAIEYHNSAGSSAFNVVAFRMKDAANFDLTVTRYGKVSIQATYKLTPDGKSLTYSYNGNVIVYRRWDALD